MAAAPLQLAAGWLEAAAGCVAGGASQPQAAARATALTLEVATLAFPVKRPAAKAKGLEREARARAGRVRKPEPAGPESPL